MQGEVREMEREWSNIKPTYRSIRLKIKVYLRSDVQFQPESYAGRGAVLFTCGVQTVGCSEPTVPTLDPIYLQKGCKRAFLCGVMSDGPFVGVLLDLWYWVHLKSGVWGKFMWSPEQFKAIWQKLSTTDNLYDNNVLCSWYTCQLFFRNKVTKAWRETRKSQRSGINACSVKAKQYENYWEMVISSLVDSKTWKWFIRQRRYAKYAELG